MNTITIIFIGLIIHVNQPWSFDNTAVLPYQKDHRAVLKIPKDAVESPSRWLKEELEGDTYEIELDGLNVRVEGTRGVFANKDRRFMESVPSLRSIAPKCARMRPEVVDRTRVSKEITSYVDYRGGKMTTTSSYLPWKLAFPRSAGAAWRKERCVACEVQYRAHLKNDEALLVISGGSDGEQKVRLKGNPVIEVSNMPKYDGDHFIHHYNIFESNCAVLPAVTEKRCLPESEVCNRAVRKRTDDDSAPAPGVDCTNSQWP